MNVAPEFHRLGPRGIVWIAGYPRSGSTWMRVFLYNLIRLAGGHPAVDDYINDLGRIGPLERARADLFQRFLGKPVGEATWDEVVPVRPRVHAAIAEEADGLVMAGTHNALGVVMDVPLINMDATSGAIYVMRNPLDVAVSLAAYHGQSIDQAIERMGTAGCQTANAPGAAYEHLGSWSENVLTWVGSQQPTIFPVRYEDMLAIPGDVFGAVARFVAQPATPAQLAEAIDLAAFDRLHRMEQTVGFAEAATGRPFFRSGHAGQWRDAMTEEQVRRVVADHHDMMVRAGYLSDDLSGFAPAPSPAT
jgi:hypothetical protein